MSVVISSDLVVSASSGSVLPLNYARIGYHSYLETSMFTSIGSPAMDGYPLSNMLTDQTFEYYKSSGTFPAYFVIDLGIPREVDYFAIAGFNNTQITLAYSYDGSYYEALPVISGNTQTANMILFNSITARYWQVIVGGASGNNVQISNMKLGIATAMERPIYGGHSPITLSRSTGFRPNVSEGGEFLGRSIVRKGYNATYDYQHLTAQWYRNTFDKFVEYARTGAFYIAWNPLQYPKEMVYGWINQDIIPSNMGIRDLMSVSFTVEGYDVNR